MWLSHSNLNSFPDPDDDSGTIKALSATCIKLSSKDILGATSAV